MSQSLHHLPVLEPYVELARRRLKHTDDVYQSLIAVTPKDLRLCSHQQLRAKGNHFGAFYIRLADIARLPAGELQVRPSRVVSPPDRSGYVSGEGLGLSSPIGSERLVSSQPSSFSLSESDPVERPEHVLRTKHEVVTAGMAAEFISAVLDICSEQKNSDSRIEFTPAPTTYIIESQWLQSVCQDDGSFIRRKKSKLDRGWVSQGHNLAMFEAKALYTSWNEEEDVAQISTSVRAQLACEVFGSIFQRLNADDDPDDLSCKDRHVFLISAHQTSLTFTHTTINKDYLDYLQSDSPTDSLPFLSLVSSEQFDIEKVPGRIEAAISIMALVSFLDDTEKTET
ncbi:hypothetical protein VE04_08346 [Pseudogymnoascus sp. 24MN13]|nr:hypothetical protein VE04_08346 [Pseudogymnoascus sp. 24MN13]